MSRYYELLKHAEVEDRTHSYKVAANRVNPVLLSKALNGEDMRVQIQISKFVQQVFLSGPSAPRVVALFEPETDGESSDICARTARLLAAHVQEDVCAVDCQVDRPSLHKHFGLSNERGFSEAIVDTNPSKTYALKSAIPNLWILPAGGSAEALAQCTSTLPAFMEELRSQFGFVVVNAPLGSRCAEGTAIGILADAAVLVVKANQTTRAASRRAKDYLEAANVRVIGALLTQHTPAIPEVISRSL
jgi:polysaccharide biosynthesis transport protein